MSFRDRETYAGDRTPAQKKMNLGLTIGSWALTLGLVCYLGYLVMVGLGIGYRNVRTPAGYMGYVTQKSVFGSARFVDVQGGDGPTSSGMRWLYDVTNVSITPYTMSEQFEGAEGVQASDNTLMEFQINIKWRVRPTKADVKRFVEQYASLDHKDHPDQVVVVAYNNYMKQPLRNASRQQVEKIGALAIKGEMGHIGRNLKDLMVEMCKDTPFEILDVSFGFLHYPPSVTESVAEAIATTQLLAQKDTEIKIQEQERLKRVIEAEALAEATKIIRSKLTARYLQYEAIEVQAATVDGPNATTLIVPSGPLGLPLTDPNLFKTQPPAQVPAQPMTPPAASGVTPATTTSGQEKK